MESAGFACGRLWRKLRYRVGMPSTNRSTVLTAGAAPPPSTPPARLPLMARVRSSPWAGVVWRGLGLLAALLVLGWIGRSAAAGSPNSPPFGPTDSPSPPAIGPIASAALAEERDGGASHNAADAQELLPPAPTPPSTASRGRASPSDPVFLNDAGEEELRRLPGVGAKRAAAILALRQKLGHFRRLEDLLRTKGIGRAAIKKWRPLVRLDSSNDKNAADAGVK